MRLSIPRRNLPKALATRLPKTPDFTVTTVNAEPGEGAVTHYDGAGVSSAVFDIETGKTIKRVDSPPGGGMMPRQRPMRMERGQVFVQFSSYGKTALLEAFEDDLPALGAEDPDDDELPLEVRGAIRLVANYSGPYRADEAERMGLTYSKDDPAPFAGSVAGVVGVMLWGLVRVRRLTLEHRV